MGDVVAPMLEEIIQNVDAMLTEDHSEFAKLPIDLRMSAALETMAAAGFAKLKSRRCRTGSWTPTKRLLAILGYPRDKAPSFSPYVTSGAGIPDEAVESALQYGSAFLVGMVEFKSLMQMIAEGFHAYAAGCVDWDRGLDGKLRWRMTDHGRSVMSAMDASTGTLN